MMYARSEHDDIAFALVCHVFNFVSLEFCGSLEQRDIAKGKMKRTSRFSLSHDTEFAIVSVQRVLQMCLERRYNTEDHTHLVISFSVLAVNLSSRFPSFTTLFVLFSPASLLLLLSFSMCMPRIVRRA